MSRPTDQPGSGSAWDDDVDGMRGRLAGSVRWAAAPPDAWARVTGRVRARRRRRTAVVAGVSSLAVCTAAALVVAFGATGLAATSARFIGPSGYPDSTSTSMVRASDPAFDYFADVTTLPELWSAGPSPEVLATLSEAEDLLIRDCMRAGGSDWTWPDEQVVLEQLRQQQVARRAEVDQAPVGDVAYATANGYNMDDTAPDRTQGEPGGDRPANPGFGIPQGGDVDEALRLLNGSGDEANVPIDESDGSLRVPGDGCEVEAQTQLYGDYVQWTRSRMAVMDRLAPTNARGMMSEFDPDIRAADVRWAGCMVDKGWPGFDRQQDAWSMVWNDYVGVGHPDAAAVEREVAVADAECAVAVGYPATLAEAEGRLLDHLTQDPDITAYGALIEEALPRAEALLEEQRAGEDTTSQTSGTP